MTTGSPIVKRTIKRSRVLLHATISVAEWKLEARLRDLSTVGAMLESETPPSPGIEVTFSRGDTNIASRVAWVDGQRFGVVFDRPITADEVLGHVGPQFRVTAPAYYRRPSIDNAPATPVLKLV